MEVVDYSRTVPPRRCKMLNHLGVTTVVDVGANVGQYGIELRKHGYAGRIISLEPLGKPFASLSALADTFPPWTTEKIAIGREAGELTINISADDVFSSALPIDDRTVNANSRARYVGKETVPVETLDGLFIRHGLDPARTAVKIDVQGLEREVLAGGERAMTGAVLADVEMCPETLYGGQMLMREILDEMDRFGFNLCAVENVMPNEVTGRFMACNGIFARL
jgi:FkbM family methyltransferase